jgi:nitrous oxidase accessory protein NosD
MKSKTAVKKSAYTLTVLLTVTVIASLIGTAFANPLPAPPILTIYIKSDGSIDPPNVPIQRNGNTYTFTGDIKNATIEIQKNNTILDGKGHILYGYSRYTAINITNKESILIKSINITNFDRSILLTNSSYITILNNTMQTLGNIALEDSNNNQIISNNITGQDKGYGCGIQLLKSSSNLIAANNLKDTGLAIRIALSKNNTFYYNNFLEMTEYGNKVVGYIEDDNLELWSDKKQGNYWSNYDGVDANNDGVGDTPYIIDKKRQDPYPLMTPYNTTDIKGIDIHMPTLEQDQNHTTTIAAAATATIITAACLAIYLKKRNH